MRGFFVRITLNLLLLLTALVCIFVEIFENETEATTFS